MNTQHNLPSVGQIYLLKGSKFQVISVVAGVVRFASLHGGQIRQLPIEKYNALLAQRLIQPDPESPLTSSQNNAISPQALSDRETAEMNRRLRYVRPIVATCEYPTSQRHIKPLLPKLAEEVGDTSVPGASTVCKWVKSFNESHSNPLSLVPLARNRGCRDTKLPAPIEKRILERIEQDYLTPQRLTAAKVHSHINGELIEQYGDDRILPEDFRLPSLRTVQRRIARLDPYHRMRSRHGAYYANRKFKAAGVSQLATRPLEYVEADGQLLDIIVRHPTNPDIKGRPYATAVMDRYTRAILAIVITFIPFSAPTLLKALKLAVGGPSRGFFGMIEKLIVDNGSDYISNSVRNFCNATGIWIEHGSPRSPDTKPHKERFFGVLNTDVIHTLPGTTFSNPTDRGDYNSEKMACLTIDELEKIVLKWIDNDYHVRPHSTTGRAPAKLWAEATDRDEVASFPPGDLDIIARTVVSRTINKGRITVENLTWYSPALAVIEQEFKSKKQKPRVEVYLDELDLGCVFVKDPRVAGEFIPAKCTLPAYTCELSLYEHRLTQKRLRLQSLRDLEAYGQNALFLERWKTWKAIEALKDKSSRKRLLRMEKMPELKALEAITGLSDPISEDDSVIESPSTGIRSATTLDSSAALIAPTADDMPSDTDDDAPFESKRY